MKGNSVNGFTGIVFDIQRFSIEDGPGIRTSVFLKGCPLHCKWCSNPESQALDAELAYFRTNCVGCGDCVAACPEHVITMNGQTIEINRQNCTRCMVCVDACQNAALQKVGSPMSVEDVMKTVRRDLPFYQSSGGGITLTGGEPGMQAAFSSNILQRCKAEGIGTAIETCGYVQWDQMERMMEYTDIVLYDLKILDERFSREHTGALNGRILDNLALIDKLHKALYIRIPVIPGFTDSEANIKDIIAYTRNMASIVRYELLPFHQLGRHKYSALAMPYSLTSQKAMQSYDMRDTIRLFEEAGLEYKAYGA